MSHQFDAIIIGTGQAGPPLAGRLSAAGMRVAIIERHRFGGTCVNTGCIPTKTLIASAYVAQLARRSAQFGIGVPGGIQVDMKAVKARKDAISSRSSQGVEQWLRGLKNAAVYQGSARFLDPKRVAVGTTVLEAEKIFINVGARAFIPPLPGLAQVRYLTNSSMMDVDYIPPHLIVIGGSLSKLGDALLDPARQILKQRALPGPAVEALWRLLRRGSDGEAVAGVRQGGPPVGRK